MTVSEAINIFKSFEIKSPDNNQGQTNNAQKQQTYIFQADGKNNVPNDELQDEISRTYETILEENGGASFSKTYDTPKPAEKEKKEKQKENTTYTKVNKKENGLYEIEVYSDKSQSDLKETQECFIFKTDKNEKKFKFKTGNRNAIDFIDNGNEISIEISKGNRSKNYTAKKNKDGTYEIGSHKFNSIEEMAVKLNKIKLENKEAADGEINAFKQDESAMAAGDCSLLSALTAISHSGEYGKKVIDNAFEINQEENKITVNLPGFNSSYTYNLSDSNKENRYYYYSSGDTEVYFLERAINDALDDVKSGKIKLSQDAPYWCKKPKDISRGNGIHGLEPDQIFYALTGLECNDRMVTFEINKKGNKVSNEKTKKWFDKNAQKEDVSIVASRRRKKGKSTGNGNTLLQSQPEYIKIKDAFGEERSILEGHAYAVKDVSTKMNGEKVITVIDPYDTSKEIIMDESEFMNTFNILNSITLKGNNKHPKYYK